MASNCGVYPLGRDSVNYVLPEPEENFGEQVIPSGTAYLPSDAIAPLSMSMTFEQARDFAETAAGTRARVKDRLIEGKSSAGFTVETYLEVSSDDAAGAERGPDAHNLLKAAIGDSLTTDGETPARDLQYQPATTACLPSFNLIRTVPGVFSETLYGCMVDTFSISMSSGDPVQMSFSGSAYNHVQTGAFLVADGVDYSVAGTPANIEASPKFDVYQVQPKTQDFGNTANGASSLYGWDKDKTNGGFGFNECAQVGAIAEDAGTFTSVTPRAGPDATAPGSNRLVVPFVPEGLTTFYTKKPISSTQGSISITPYTSADTTANPPGHAAITNAPITAMDIQIANNISAIDNQAFTKSAFAGGIPGFRDVTGTISMRVKKEFQGLLLHRRDLFRRCLIEIKLGNELGRHVQIDMQYVEIDPSSIEVSGQDEMTVSMPFKSLVASSDAGDVVRDFQMEYK